MKMKMKEIRAIISKVIAEAGPDIPDVMGAMGGGKFQPREGEDYAADTEVNEDGDALFVMVDDLVTSMKMGRVSAEAIDEGDDGEIYIMTGASEGITVKVLRRGR
jgi:hypothetical protein